MGLLVFLIVLLAGGAAAWKAGYARAMMDRVRFFAGESATADASLAEVETWNEVAAHAASIPFEESAAHASSAEPVAVVGPLEVKFEANWQRILEAQIALDGLGISPGSIDGVLGGQSRLALRAFQVREGLPVTGGLDAATLARLPRPEPALVYQRVHAGDLARLSPVAATWLGKSEQERLDYETALEWIAEHSHAHPHLIRRLNPGMDFLKLAPGTAVLVPSVERPAPHGKAAFLLIRLGERTLQAFDDQNRLLAHFPCSIAQRVEKRPVGELRVAVLAPNPDYTFNPEIFPESAEARELGRKLRLPPGPNNPVGTVWIGLDRPSYGIHGTPKPEDVGRTESHGCFRLANWNAEYLLELVSVGTRVRVEP